MSLQLAALTAYALAVIGLGLWYGRRVHDGSDFFIAGRQLGPGLVFSTMFSAAIGAGSTVGATSAAYVDGLGAWWWIGSGAVGSLVLGFVIGPRFRRVAAEGNLNTVGDYLEHRYDERVRGVVAALIWAGSLFMLASQLIGVGWILNAAAGIPASAGSAIGGLVICTCVAAGGLRGSARVSVLHVTVKVIGLAVAITTAVAWSGGWSAVGAVRAEDGAYWHFARGSLKYLALIAPAFAVSPALLQKIPGAQSDRAVRLGVGVNTLAMLLFASAPVVLGIIARQRFPGIVNSPDLALPMMLTSGLPAAAGAAALVAVVAAHLGAAEAVLFLLATSVSQDLYKRFINPDAADERLVNASRAVTIVSGALAVGLALFSRDLVQTLEIFYALLGVGLFVPIVAGLYVRRANADAALASILGGIGGMLVVQGATDGAGFGRLDPAPAGLACAVLGWLISLTFTPKSANKSR